MLQRFEAVEPARAALVAALAAPAAQQHARDGGAALEAALKLARPAASLLDERLLAQAEVRMAR